MQEEKEKHHHGGHELPLVINGKRHEWEGQYITGAEIRKLGEISPDVEIYLAIKRPWEDELVKDESRQDLARPGVEHFFTKTHKHHLVTIKINDLPHEVHRSKYSVGELKVIGKVPPEYELQELIDGKLVPLADNATVLIKGCEEFFSTVKGGGSS